MVVQFSEWPSLKLFFFCTLVDFFRALDELTSWKIRPSSLRGAEWGLLSVWVFASDGWSSSWNVKHQVNLSLGLNTGGLLLRPQSLPMCWGVHAFSQRLLQLHNPLCRLPHSILGSGKRKLDGGEGFKRSKDFWGEESNKNQEERGFILSSVYLNYCESFWNRTVLCHWRKEAVVREAKSFLKRNGHRMGVIRHTDRVWKRCEFLYGVDWVRSHQQFVCGLPDTYSEREKMIRLLAGWWDCEEKHWTEIINLPIFYFLLFKKKI